MMQFGDTIAIKYPEKLIETYVRSWRERLFTRPWRPFQRLGEREIPFSLVRKRMLDTARVMQANLEAEAFRKLK